MRRPAGSPASEKDERERLFALEARSRILIQCNAPHAWQTKSGPPVQHSIFAKGVLDLIAQWLCQIGERSTRAGLNEDLCRHARDKLDSFQRLKLVAVRRDTNGKIIRSGFVVRALVGRN